MNKSKKITKNTKISEILEENPDAAEFFYDIGFGCAGCVMNVRETLEQGAKVHGMTEVEVKEILKELNKKKSK